MEWQMEPAWSVLLVHISQTKEALNVSSVHSDFHTQNQEQCENHSVSTYVSVNINDNCKKLLTEMPLKSDVICVNDKTKAA